MCYIIKAAFWNSKKLRKF